MPKRWVGEGLLATGLVLADRTIPYHVCQGLEGSAPAIPSIRTCPQCGLVGRGLAGNRFHPSVTLAPSWGPFLLRGPARMQAANGLPGAVACRMMVAERRHNTTGEE